ncbi:MAG: LamG domain-containing protein [Solirubrobacterales bacterium]
MHPDLLQGKRHRLQLLALPRRLHSGYLEGFVADESEEFSEVKSKAALPVKAWSHVAFTSDGAYLRLYVDGALVDTENASEIAPSEGPLYLGCWPSEGEHFEGRIDEVRVYDRALDGGEVQATLNSTFPVAVTTASEEAESNQAIMTGTVEVRGDETNYFFEYGPTTSYGNIATGEELEGDGETVEAEDVAINLTPETTYHYRLVAESPLGVAYGEDQEFVTGKRVMTIEEEEEETAAEEAPEEELPSFASSSALTAPADFFGMMWTGNISKMLKHNTFDAVENSGAKVFRFVAAPGANVVTALSQAKSHNLIPLPFLGSGNWPKPGSDAADNFVKYAEHAVETYGPGTSYDVDTWEMWNEPNMRQPINLSANPPVYEDAEHQGKVRPAEFAEFYKEVVQGIRSAKKGVHIVGPGLFGYRSNVKEKRLTPRAFLKQFNEALKTEPKLEEPYGALSLHPYRFKTKIKKGEKLHVPKNEADAIQVRKEVKSMIAGVHNLQAKQLGGSKPIWITELGFPVRSEEGGKPSTKIPAVSEPEQKLLVRQTLWALLHSPARLEVDRAIYYNIEDRPAEFPGENGGGWDHHSGLLTEGRQPRPAWTAYANLAGGKECPHSAPC